MSGILHSMFFGGEVIIPVPPLTPVNFWTTNIFYSASTGYLAYTQNETDSFATIYQSSNGIVFSNPQSINPTSAGTVRAIASNGTTIVAACARYSSPNVLGLYSSTDGINFTLRRSLSYSGYTDPQVQYLNGTFFACGGVDGSFNAPYYTSTDGITWTQRSWPSGYGGTWKRLAFSSDFSRYYKVSSSSDGILSSTNGTSWSAILSNASDFGTDGSIVAKNGFVMSPNEWNDPNLDYAYTTNGTTVNFLSLGTTTDYPNFDYALETSSKIILPYYESIDNGDETINETLGVIVFDDFDTYSTYTIPTFETGIKTVPSVPDADNADKGGISPIEANGRVFLTVQYEAVTSSFPNFIVSTVNGVDWEQHFFEV